MSEEQVTPLEVVAPISPEGFEEAMVKQAAEAPLGNPEDQAAAMFQKHALRLVQHIPHMKKNELVRIILHAGLHPLYENKKKLKNETEALIAHDLEQLLLCKAIMSIQVAAEDMQTKDKELVKGSEQVAEEPAKTVAEATGEVNV